MSHLITASLVGSIDWLKKCPPSWKAKATKDLKSQLARDYSEPMSPALKLGIAFEDAVYKATTEEPKGSEHFKRVVDECRGAEFQRKTKQMLTIDGQEYCLYGKIDAWFPTIIKDVKTTSNYKGPGHYLSSFQHKLYCLNEKIMNFRYVIAEFNEEQKVIGYHAVDAEMGTDLLGLEDEVVTQIKEAITFLKSSTELYTLYTTKFSQY